MVVHKKCGAIWGEQWSRAGRRNVAVFQHNNASNSNVTSPHNSCCTAHPAGKQMKWDESPRADPSHTNLMVLRMMVHSVWRVIAAEHAHGHPQKVWCILMVWLIE